MCHEVSRLRGLVRLVDYMVAEVYVEISVSAASELLAYFEDPNKVRVRTGHVASRRMTRISAACAYTLRNGTCSGCSWRCSDFLLV